MNVEDLQEGNQLPKIDELATLKGRADVMGVKYHPSIGVDALRQKINAALDGKPDPDDAVAVSTPATAPVPTKSDDLAESPGQKKARMKREAGKLVRINVQCMNPAKKEWDGEIMTTGNANIGTFKKFVKFNTTEGWHVPAIILTMLRNRECQTFYDETVRVAGRDQKVRRGRIIREFAIEVLEPLTQKELDKLARLQVMSTGVEA